MRHHGKLIIVTGPSGSGKLTLATHIVETIPNFQLSVSATTRPPRSGEVDGKDHFFLTNKEFNQKVQGGFFLEYAERGGNRYGTLRKPIEEIIDLWSRNVILVAGVHSALNVLQQMPTAISIFVMPPEPRIKTLRERLEIKGTKSNEVVEQLLLQAEADMYRNKHFHHIVTNDQLLSAKAHVTAFVKGVLRPVDA